MKSYFVKRLLDMIYAKNRMKKVANYGILYVKDIGMHSFYILILKLFEKEYDWLIIVDNNN